MRSATACFVVSLFLAVTAACSSDESSEPGGPGSGGSAAVDGGTAATGGGAATGGSSAAGGSGGSKSDAGVPGTVCFLDSCTEDGECADCSFGRNRCDIVTSRCVACDPAAATGCPSGKECSQFGTCITPGQTCATDAQGNPTVSCTTAADCAACDPQHQLCDNGRCVACSPTDSSACSGDEYCSATGSCEAKCPTSCSSDADCGRCGSSEAPANACNPNTGKCGQCSPTKPCPAGQACTPQGACIAFCGQPGKPKGTCSSDDDCKGCGADAVACILPVNGGDGKCGVAAGGCSDLGNGVFALPPPWNSVTNTCSSDADCSGVGTNLNVGKMLRDLSGLSLFNDATLQYEMNACASVEVALPKMDPVSCGICVPCKTDADCHPIDVDPLVSQLFDGLGSIAARWALDQLYGDDPHVVNMYCQNVTGEYGVCLPCGDPTSVCGVPQTVGQGCTNVYECAAGEFCKDGTCQETPTSCFGGGTVCSGGTVCAWNGDGYCCRQPGGGSVACATDAECTGTDVCAWNGSGFFCQPRDTTCSPN